MIDSDIMVFDSFHKAEESLNEYTEYHGSPMYSKIIEKKVN
jgi:hypothetical protein